MNDPCERVRELFEVWARSEGWPVQRGEPGGLAYKPTTVAMAFYAFCKGYVAAKMDDAVLFDSLGGQV